MRAALLAAPAIADHDRAPGKMTRYPEISECVDGEAPGPCAHTECRYHLARGEYWDWDHQLRPTRDCSLDVANQGGRTHEEVAAAFRMSAERVRQIEGAALERLRRSRALKTIHGAR